MRSLISFTFLALIFAGCCSLPRPPLPVPDEGASVQIAVDKSEASMKRFSVKLEFYEWEDEYDCLVQEIFLPGGSTLVEVFKMENGRFLRCRIDHHRMEYDEDFLGVYTRRMFLYPANVEGVDWRRNFAHLPENRDGSVRTTVGPGFNESYQEDHETRGRIVNDDRANGFWWTLEWQNGEVEVQIPEEHRYTAE